MSCGRHTDKQAMNTLLEKIGGIPSLKTLVKELYIAVINDRELLPFFEDTINSPLGIIELERKQKNFFTAILSDKCPDYFDLEKSHMPLVQKGLSDHHFNLLVCHLKKALVKIEVSLETQNIILQKVENTRKEVLCI